MNVKISIEYDGSSYCGWQRQANAVSIQQTIEEALKKVTGEDISIISSGRTDAGVHALEQVANFKTNTKIPLEKLPLAINSQLPRDVVVKSAEKVERDFHARYCAKDRTYEYKIYNAPFPSPLFRRYSFWCSRSLNIQAMAEAGRSFLGTHDFSAFMTSGSPVKTPVREIIELSVKRKCKLITIEVRANGFLYNMMRILAGTLLDVGLGNTKIDEIRDIIMSKDRRLAGKTLPPQGLYLTKVRY